MAGLWAFVQANGFLVGSLLVAILDAVISAHPGIPADSLLEMLKVGVKALLGSAPVPKA